MSDDVAIKNIIIIDDQPTILWKAMKQGMRVQISHMAKNAENELVGATVHSDVEQGGKRWQP